MKPKLGIVQLGRYGDIINMLPLYKHLGANRLYVNERFKDVVPEYAVPYAVGTMDLTAARRLAESECEQVIVTQVAGNPNKWNMHGNFTLAQWAPWHGLYHELPLDLEPLADYGYLAKDLIVCLEGHSSPCPYAEELRKWILGTFDALDLSFLRLPNIRDVVSVLRAGKLLLTTDTSVLHLSYACGIPTIALQPDAPWFRSERRKHWLTAFSYGQGLQVVKDYVYDLARRQHLSV